MSEETLNNIETAVVEDTKPEEAVTPEAVEEPKAEEPKVEEPKVEDVVVEEPTNVVEAPKPSKVAGLAPVESGAIGSTKVEKAPKAPKVEVETASEKVAIFSDKNVTWPGIGKVYRGINLVTKDAADKWLTRSHVRTATPQEVAKEYGL